MTVVLTGGTGHIGSNLARALAAAGRRVRLIVRQDLVGVAGLDVETVQGDVRDPDSLQRAFRGADVVYHLAARIAFARREEAECITINVDGTRNVVEACLAAGVRRMVHCSSVHALRQAPFDQPIDEDRPTTDDPRDLYYDRTKAAGEAAVRAGIARGLDAVILNPAGIIGRHDYRPSRMGAALIKMYDGTLPALVRAGYDWVDVRDVVAGAMAAEARGVTGRRYLLTGHWASMPELAALVGAFPGARPPRFAAPMWLARIGLPFVTGWAGLRRRAALYDSASLRVLGGNTRFIRRNAGVDLDYTPRPLAETIADTLGWFEAEGRLGRRAARVGHTP